MAKRRRPLAGMRSRQTASTPSASPGVLWAPVAVATATAVITLLGLNAANLLTGWVYWALGLLIILALTFSAGVYCWWNDLSPRGAVVAVPVLQVLLAVGVVAVVQAADDLRCRQAQTHLEPGLDLQEGRQDERASNAFAAALGFCVDGRAYLYMGYIESDLGRHERALDYFTLAVRALRPDEAKQLRGAYPRIGKPNADLGNCDAAVVAYQAGIRVDPTYGPLHHNLALARSRQGIMSSPTFPGALESIGVALQATPDETQYLLTRAKIQWVLGDFGAAGLDVRRIIQIGPKPGDGGSQEHACQIAPAISSRQPAPPDTALRDCR